VLALVAASRPLDAFAQHQGKVWRIGYLSLASGPDKPVEDFREELRDLGYAEGRKLLIEYRWAAGSVERLKEFATEFVGKRLQMLHEVVPKAARVAVLVWKNFETKLKVLILGQTREAAQRMGVALVIQEAATADELAGVFDAMQRERAQALIVLQNPFADEHSKQIVDLARKHRLPAMFESRGHVDVGGSMSYGASTTALRRRMAHYVDKIFKGAKPADLPIEQPTVYELVVNLKTAKALGLTIPQAVLTLANDVIQ